MKIAREIKEQGKTTTLEEFLSGQENMTSQSNNIEPSSSMTHFQQIKKSTHRIPSRNMSLSRSSDKINSNTNNNPEDEHLKLEISRLQHALIETFKGPQKSVSGAQFRGVVRERVSCEQCDNKDHIIKRAKENIRSLKYQISQLEDRISGKPMTRSNIPDFNTVTTDLDDGRCEALEQQIKQLEATMNEQTNAKDSLQRELMKVTEQSVLTQKENHDIITQLQAKNSVLLVAMDEKDKHIAMLRTQLDMKSEYTQSLEDQIKQYNDGDMERHTI
jgi:BMFP domain-containing protein YqiC